MTFTLIVHGWYGRGNLGDELIGVAIRELFKPYDVNVQFTQCINTKVLQNADGILFGGGGILGGPPVINNDAFELLLRDQIPIFYVGVGYETNTHPQHQQLLRIAKVIRYRECDMPDLVYSLKIPDDCVQQQTHSGILLIPNIETVPTYQSEHWVHVAWERYKNELAQVLDYFVNKNVKLSFMIMCKNLHMEDTWAASEIIARMKRGGWHKNFIHPSADDPNEICKQLSQFDVIVTQRYHGIILAEMTGVPYVAIDHHDKLKNVTPHSGQHVPYHGVVKSDLISHIENALNQQHIVPYRPLTNTYDSIIIHIIDWLGRKHGKV